MARLSIKQVAERSGVPERTIYRWVQLGMVPGRREGHHWVLKPAVLRQIAEAAEDRTKCYCGQPRLDRPSYKGRLCADCLRAYNSSYVRLKKFGLTPADYERMLAEQDGVCAICGEPEKETRNGRVRDLAVDHCHVTGRIRGLLCGKCNRSLPAFETPGWTKAAKRYLKNHS